MPEFRLNGKPQQCPAGITVLAALQNLQEPLRQSVSGLPRGALCGMGICFECRIRIDGRVQKACQVLLQEGMEVNTHAAQ